MTEHVYCGYVKVKFPLEPWTRLEEHASYRWANEISAPRITGHFIYVALGHKDIRDNAHARSLLRRIEQYGGKVTRLDFHIDYLGALNFDAFYAIHDNDRKPTPQIVKSPNGATVYIGRRSSARMLRVYDKRCEILAKKHIDIGFELTRIEIEIKRNMIKRYLTLFMDGNTLQILQDIQSLYGLHGFCDLHTPSKPLDVGDKFNDCFTFVQRFKRIIREAYLTDKVQFFDVIGVENNES